MDIHIVDGCACAACSQWKARRYLIQKAAARMSTSAKRRYDFVSFMLVACAVATLFAILLLPVKG